PGARVVSDGLGCFGGLADAWLKHKAVVTGSGRPKHERFKWTNTGLGNIKSAITGTCRSFDPRHTERYLASYEWRFNRRFDLDKNVERLARVAALTAPKYHRSIAGRGNQEYLWLAFHWPTPGFPAAWKPLVVGIVTPHHLAIVQRLLRR